jgi:hypothetical protein
MKIYYIRHNEESLGPYSKEELKLVGVYYNDFIWKGGLGTWIQAKDLVELKDIIVFPNPDFSVPAGKSNTGIFQRFLLSLKKTSLTKLLKLSSLPKK